MSSTLSKAHLPAIWLIIALVGLPQLSETVYSPSLPEIARTLATSESMAEYTLTIYLFGFALGTFFWGKVSDRWGRKPCVLAGLFIFGLGCIGCYYATSITSLMISRLIQAFGGSIGSVLGQAICRDAFHGPALSRAYSAVGSALGLFPAVGPVIGGEISERLGWSVIFLFLLLCAAILSLVIMMKLPETHNTPDRKPISLKEVALRLLKDKRAWGFGLIVGGANGIFFTYFAEGPFYLIKGLGLSPSKYGATFIPMILATMAGGLISKKLHAHRSSETIMGYGLGGMVISSGLFSLLALWYHMSPFAASWMIVGTLLSYMILMGAFCVTISNALALALVAYKGCIGTASSLFGGFYYVVISLLTWGMGSLHNGTLLPMPLYFLALSISMLAVQRTLTRSAD